MRFSEKYVRLEGRTTNHKGSIYKSYKGLKTTRCGIAIFPKIDKIMANRPHKNLCKNCMGTRGE